MQPILPEIGLFFLGLALEYFENNWPYLYKVKTSLVIKFSLMKCYNFIQKNEYTFVRTPTKFLLLKIEALSNNYKAL